MESKLGGAEPLPYEGDANYRKEIPKFLFGNSSEERANNVRPYQDRKRSFEESYGFFYDTPPTERQIPNFPPHQFKINKNFSPKNFLLNSEFRIPNLKIAKQSNYALCIYLKSILLHKHISRIRLRTCLFNLLFKILIKHICASKPCNILLTLFLNKDVVKVLRL